MTNCHILAWQLWEGDVGRADDELRRALEAARASQASRRERDQELQDRQDAKIREATELGSAFVARLQGSGVPSTTWTAASESDKRRAKRQAASLTGWIVTDYQLWGPSASGTSVSALIVDRTGRLFTLAHNAGEPGQTVYCGKLPELAKDVPKELAKLMAERLLKHGIR